MKMALQDGAGLATRPEAPSGLVAGQAAPEAGGKELTAFFSIGAVINVVLLAAFLVWAVGEWRKTRK